MFLNISNHKSENWSANQTSEAEKYGEIVDIPFPAVNPIESDKYMDDLVEAYYQKVMEYEKPTVMVQGEFVFTYRLVNQLKQAGIKVVASCSERRVTEEIDENGCTIRRSQFEFVKFREY